MHRRTLLTAALAAPGAAALATPAQALGRVRSVATRLDIPWGLDFLPDGSALVTERDTSRLLQIAGGRTRVVARVPAVVPGGEGGLLGLAVSPRFAEDRRVYLYLTTRSDNRVAWAQLVDGRLGPLQPIVTGIPKGRIHNGGSLLFDRDGLLLIGCGESGRRRLAQNLDSLGGKVLRVDPDGSAPSTNPFVGRGGDDRIYSYGHRNPQGLAQRAVDGAIWSAELGWNTFDELNRIVPGRNYGWPRAEGTDGPGGYADPFVQFRPAVCSPSGVAVVGNRAFLGALRGESLWVVTLDGPRARRRVRHLRGRFGRIRNVKQAPDGSLWLTTSNGRHRDRVLRVRL